MFNFSTIIKHMGEKTLDNGGIMTKKSVLGYSSYQVFEKKKPARISEEKKSSVLEKGYFAAP